MRSCIAACLGLISLTLTASAAEPPRPNVLWLCADDHAAYALGAYGNRQVRTPNLDRLAAQGMRFDRAYCNSPVCTASRQSFLTGRYPRTIGVTLLRTPLPDEETTLAELLRDAGYETAAIGKMHFNSKRTHGFELRLDLPDHRQWLQQKGKQPLPPGEVQPAWRPFRDPARVWLNSECLPYGAVESDMAGTWFAGEAVRFLQTKRDRPFFLMCSFTEPHSPFHFPVEFRGRHRPERFAVPKVGPEDEWHIPAVFRDLSDKEKQGIMAAYYTSVEFLDMNVGRVLDALEQAGLAKNTLVIYTGDHGYMLGHHGRFEKHCSFEPAVRSPLLVRLPGKVQSGGSSTALVEFIDILPMVLDYCQVKPPANVQGISLSALLDGRAERHRDHVIAEYSENEEAMIRTERWKLIYSTGKRERQDGYATGRPLPGRTVLLYDLRNDADEMTNLASRPEHAGLVQELTRKLADHMRRTARRPELVPATDDAHEVLGFCLQPRDVAP